MRRRKYRASFPSETMLGVQFLMRFTDSYFGNKYRLSKQVFSRGEPQYIEFHKSMWRMAREMEP